MNKYILVNIENRNCIGLFLEVDKSFDIKLNTIKAYTDLLKKSKKIKMQLRTKIDGKRGKKNFTFNYHETKKDKELLFVKSFKDVLDIIDSKRLDIKEKIKAGETLREKKAIDANDEKEKITFLIKLKNF